MSSFCTVEDVKQYLNIKSGNDDIFLSRLINACSSMIETFCNRKFDLQEYTESFSYRNSRFHVCKNGPLVSLVSVDNVSPERLSNVALDGYKLTFNDGVLQNENKITYIAGYAVIPADIQQACIELVSIKYKTREHIDVSQRAIGGETISYIVKDMPDYVKVVLQKYKRYF